MKSVLFYLERLQQYDEPKLFIFLAHPVYYHVCVKRFSLLTAMQKLFKSIVFFHSYDHKCILPPFFGLQYILRRNQQLIEVWLYAVT